MIDDDIIIVHKIGRTLVAQGISIALAIHSLDLLVCAYHNLTDCGIKECSLMLRIRVVGTYNGCGSGFLAR